MDQLSKDGGIQRFIPAYAGNSGRPPFTPVNTAVHPRLRGELKCTSILPISSLGSSPLTRGTLSNGADGLRETTVHPRLRGELRCLGTAKASCFGSSPLTRGTRGWSWLGCYKGWFIPAYAGNSKAATANCILFLVHPRLRGELSPSSMKFVNIIGSSPLTRGTHLKTV